MIGFPRPPDTLGYCVDVIIKYWKMHTHWQIWIFQCNYEMGPIILPHTHFTDHFIMVRDMVDVYVISRTIGRSQEYTMDGMIVHRRAPSTHTHSHLEVTDLGQFTYWLVFVGGTQEPWGNPLGGEGNAAETITRAQARTGLWGAKTPPRYCLMWSKIHNSNTKLLKNNKLLSWILLLLIYLFM